MDLPNLLIRLEPLVADAEANWERITQLLEDHQDLAEFEVARYYASQQMEPTVQRKLGSLDPLERRQGVDAIRQLFSRAAASKLLRHMVKDPDQRVAVRARAAMRALGLNDVALRDTRFPLPRWPRPLAPGGFNPTGWSFGLFRHGQPVSQAPASERADLPLLLDADMVAELVGFSSAEELTPLTRPGHGRGAPYVTFTIPKASGGERHIWAPRPTLRRVQRLLLDRLLSKLPTHPAAHGFVPGRSTVTNAAPHQGASIVVKLDLADFFPTIHYRRVAGLFRHYGYSKEVAGQLASLTTHRPVLDDGRVVWPGRLPQGAPTSPALANLVCRRLDARLSGLATQIGARYTRYADDLTFSFHAEPEHGLGRFFWWVEQICIQEGFRENAAKRRVLRQSAQQRITGVVVNSGLRVPRQARRRFRAVLHNCRVRGVASQARGRDDFVDSLRGFAAYVKMIQPDHGERLMHEVEEVLQFEASR